MHKFTFTKTININMHSIAMGQTDMNKDMAS